ncbi:hypothetical protein JGH11_14545 [Dysgonomonas sp. Marseille-P4677]|uniref:hypothetical protein n=1 Tax=Dysgonomonas sp. Marseille-P4677 TaxID=2364790 RepID=UPI0019134DDC|nr:hypothetical protein [Dysgonomonas sp. Marseille-P4677]MBK5722094.1 hypothetical protein [Dysgonomonas sp. Marseille-P4677]
MKNKLSTLLAVLIGITTLFLFGCTSLYKKPTMYLNYPTENGIIKSQPQLSSIVIAMPGYELMIDSVLIFDTKGKSTGQVQIINEGKSVRVIDILPGKHKLTVKYDNQSTRTRRPLEAEFDFQAGEIYLLQLELMDMAQRIMSFRKPKSYGLDGISLEPLPDKYKQVIIDFRNQQK